MKSFINTATIMILLSYTIGVSAQEIKVTEFRSDTKDISARENAVRDANGDACSIIKTRSGLQNLKFSSDLGIQKTEYHEGEYWLWVSPNTQHLVIESEGFGKIEYKLPSFTEEYNVYIIFLTAILPDKIIYRNINSSRIETKPTKADIYINNAFMGRSPLDINISSDTFRYEIRKKRYSNATGIYEFSSEVKEHVVSLKRDPAANRYFISLYSGGNKLGTLFFGMQAGLIGKTGWYVSFVPPLLGEECIGNVDYTLRYEEEYVSSLVGLPAGSYYFKLKDTDNSFFNHFRLKAGVTQKIFRNTYLLGGIGYSISRRFYKFQVMPYSNDPLQDVPLDKIYYAKTRGVGEIEDISFEVGLIYRISNHYLINLCFASGSTFRKPFYIIDTSMGIGYNF